MGSSREFGMHHHYRPRPQACLPLHCCVRERTKCKTDLLLLLELSRTLFSLLFLALALLEESFGDENLVLGGDRPIDSKRYMLAQSATLCMRRSLKTWHPVGRPQLTKGSGEWDIRLVGRSVLLGRHVGDGLGVRMKWLSLRAWMVLTKRSNV